MARRQYSNTATEATLTGGIAAADSSFTLTSFSGYPAVPFTATISRGAADEEVVLITAVSSATVTATRGYDGTTAKSHAAGASFIHTTIARDFDEANAHVNATTGVHGVTGSIVGTSDVQVLTNKTLTSPTLAAPTVTGTASMASVTLSGTLSVTSASSTLSSLSAGSVTISSTLAVSGASSLAGMLTGNGGITVPTGKKITLIDAPATGTDGVNKTYADAGDTAARAYTDTRETAINARTDSFGRHRGSGTAYPASPVEGDTFRRTDLGGVTYRYNGTTWVADLAEFPVARLRQTTAQTGLASGWNAIVFQAEDFDSNAAFSPGASASTYTVPAGAGGTYALEGTVGFGSVSAGLTAGARIAKNGTAIPVAQNATGLLQAGGGPVLGTGRTLVALAAGDTVTLQGFLNTAGWSTAVGGTGNEGVGSQLTIERIR